MPIRKLDLKTQKEKDKRSSQKQVREVPEKKPSKDIFATNTERTAKRGQGRPKGDPAVTRSLRIKEDINNRLVREQKLTGLSYNEIANRAFDAYLSDIK